MSVDKKRRESISKTQDIVNSIGKKLAENAKKGKDGKVDTTKMAKELSDRRETVLKEENE